MSNLIPVPVNVRIECEGKEYGHFEIMPYASTRSGSLEIDFWQVFRDSEMHDFNDVLIVEVFSKALRMRICEATFEEEICESLTVKLKIDDEEWDFEVRAREINFEEVHYEIQIEEEWYSTAETYLRDLINDEMLYISEREVLPSIDFGYGETVIQQLC